MSSDQPDLLNLKDVTGDTPTSRITARMVPASTGFVVENPGLAENVALTSATLSCDTSSPQISVAQGKLCGGVVVLCVCVYLQYST